MIAYLVLTSALLLPVSVLANGVETIIGRPPDQGRSHSVAKNSVAKKSRTAAAPGSPGGRFRQLDSNRDGRISRQEMEQGNRTRLQAFERADANGDGQLSPEEWRAYKGAKKKRKSADF